MDSNHIKHILIDRKEDVLFTWKLCHHLICTRVFGTSFKIHTTKEYVLLVNALWNDDTFIKCLIDITKMYYSKIDFCHWFVDMPLNSYSIFHLEVSPKYKAHWWIYAFNKYKGKEKIKWNLKPEFRVKHMQINRIR